MSARFALVEAQVVILRQCRMIAHIRPIAGVVEDEVVRIPIRSADNLPCPSAISVNTQPISSPPPQKPHVPLMFAIASASTVSFSCTLISGTKPHSIVPSRIVART